MYVDNFIRLADAQSVVGMGNNSINLVTTNYIDLSLARDIGEGEELSVVFSPSATVAGTTAFEGWLVACKNPITQMRSGVIFTTASPAVFTLNGHGFAPGTAVYFTQGTGTLPTAVVSGTTYYVGVDSVNAFRLHATEAAALTNTAGTGLAGTNGSGTIQVWQTDLDFIARSGVIDPLILNGVARPVVAEINPRVGELGKRYIAGIYNPSAAFTAGTFTVDIVRNIQDGRKFHASGFTVL